MNLVARDSVALSKLLYRQQQFTQFFSHWWVKLALVIVFVALAVVILRLTVFRHNRRYGRSAYGGRVRNYRGGRRRR